MLLPKGSNVEVFPSKGGLGSATASTTAQSDSEFGRILESDSIFTPAELFPVSTIFSEPEEFGDREGFEGHSGRDSPQRNPTPLQSSRWMKSDSTKPLDHSYVVRNRDYQKFFKPGRIFNILWTEPLSGNTNPKDSYISHVVYKEQVHSRIRRFVVVRKMDRSCTCLPVVTYDKVGLRKSNSLNLGEHGILYSQIPPKPIEGITASPVRLQPSRNGTNYRDLSLVDYGKPYTVEMNVKVKDLGMLDSESKRNLLTNFKSIFWGDEVQDFHITHEAEPENNENHLYRRTLNDSTLPTRLALTPHCESESSPTDGEASFRNPITKPKLHNKFAVVGQPTRFFKLGRVFKTLWSEPASGNANTVAYTSPSYTRTLFDQFVFTKIRRFVVVRERNHSCLCLPLFTYGGQGDAKSDVRLDDHIGIHQVGKDKRRMPSKSDEESPQKISLGLIIEDADEKIDPMTQINIGQVHTIQHNVKVAKIGRIAQYEIQRLDRYFLNSITGVTNTPSPPKTKHSAQASEGLYEVSRVTGSMDSSHVSGSLFSQQSTAKNTPETIDNLPLQLPLRVSRG